jgi:diaminopimelate epimerase
VDFVKMQGLGNDFIVVAGPAAISSKNVQTWCDRRFGVGADGVLLATPLAGQRVAMEYWNADGGKAEMCGNGLRCVAKLAVDRGWVERAPLEIDTAVGPLGAEVLDDGLVRALMGHPKRGDVESVEVGGVVVYPVNVGNPHAVLFVDDPFTAPVAELGPQIERSELFPAGTNVEFVKVETGSRIRMRIWERGVGETMASGTGATAAAYAAALYQGAQSPIEVLLPGGRLSVEIVDTEAWVTGPADYVFTGSIAG